MAKPSTAQIFAIDILIGVGFGLLFAVAVIFIKHNPLIAIGISIIYALIQIRSFWKLLKAKLYFGMIGRFLISSIFVCILGSFIWGIFFKGFDIGFADQYIFISIIVLSFLLALIYAILKNFFPENITYKKIEQTFAGLSAIGVLDKE